MYQLRGCRHLMLHGFVEHGIVNALLNHHIALLKCFTIAYHGAQIFGIALRYNHIHQPPALLARAADKVGVGGRHHHQGQQPNVLTQALIFFAIAARHLSLASAHTDGNLLFSIAPAIASL